MVEGPSADSEEKHEPVSDIGIAVVDSLKALDPERPIREVGFHSRGQYLFFGDQIIAPLDDRGKRL